MSGGSIGGGASTQNQAKPNYNAYTPPQNQPRAQSANNMLQNQFQNQMQHRYGNQWQNQNQPQYQHQYRYGQQGQGMLSDTAARAQNQLNQARDMYQNQWNQQGSQVANRGSVFSQPPQMNQQYMRPQMYQNPFMQQMQNPFMRQMNPFANYQNPAPWGGFGGYGSRWGG